MQGTRYMYSVSEMFVQQIFGYTAFEHRNYYTLIPLQSQHGQSAWGGYSLADHQWLSRTWWTPHQPTEHSEHHPEWLWIPTIFSKYGYQCRKFPQSGAALLYLRSFPFDVVSGMYIWISKPLNFDQNELKCHSTLRTPYYGCIYMVCLSRQWDGYPLGLGLVVEDKPTDFHTTCMYGMLTAASLALCR